MPAIRWRCATGRRCRRWSSSPRWRRRPASRRCRCSSPNSRWGLSYWPTLKGWLILLFVALGPSLTSQVFFMRGVELIGPGRAGLFSNLVPMFGALFAVLLLGEEFHLYHGVALALGLAGVWLSERKA
jgi:drug/metabolite transporter (DMT)-like permease